MGCSDQFHMANPLTIRSPRLWPHEAKATRRVTWLELFFDLIFVAAVSQVATPLTNDYSLGGVLRFSALFLLIWWAWSDHTLFSTRFDSDDLIQRLLTLLQMFAVAAMAANAMDALDSRSSAGFAAAYAVMRLILVTQYARARHIRRARPLTTHYAVGYGSAALCWLTSAVTPSPQRYWLWGIALAVDLGTSLLAARHSRSLPPDEAHLPERFGLFTIILLGESLVGVMKGMESQESWSFAAALSALLGMSLAFAFWWWYFDGAEGSAERPVQTRKQALSFQVWNVAHLPLFLGVAVVAAGVDHVVSLGGVNYLHAHESTILCGAVAVVMLALTLIGVTSDQARHGLPASVKWHCLLAAVTSLLGAVGHRIAPVFLMMLLFLLCAIAVVKATREPLGDPELESEVTDELPNFS